MTPSWQTQHFQIWEQRPVWNSVEEDQMNPRTPTTSSSTSSSSSSGDGQMLEARLSNSPSRSIGLVSQLSNSPSRSIGLVSHLSNSPSRCIGLVSHHQWPTQMSACWPAATVDSAINFRPPHSFQYSVPDGGGPSSHEACRAKDEYTFEKLLTPSDVGKLNRIVIPKQHAERCFPVDPAVEKKGLLLSFEDSNGLTWRFRYSYWSSSQSYVLTKGWSRFVKENRLEAGDVISFRRRLVNGSDWHLFIGCKHQARHGLPPGPTVPAAEQCGQGLYWQAPAFYIAGQRPEPRPDSQSDSGVKRFRLFGVNLDCSPDCKDGS